MKVKVTSEGVSSTSVRSISVLPVAVFSGQVAAAFRLDTVGATLPPAYTGGGGGWEEDDLVLHILGKCTENRQQLRWV